MKIKINLVNEERIIKQDGRYSRTFSLSKQAKASIHSKRSPAKMVINSGKEIEIEDILINNHLVSFDHLKQDQSVKHWNIPIKVNLDKKWLNVEGENSVELLFK